jgi:energy-coupling factor transport system ATP-binding protein
LLNLSDVAVSFDGKNNIVSGLRFNVEAGSCTLLTGAASAGKSTALSVCCGIVPQLVRPQRFEGKVHLEGQDIGDFDIAQLFQKFGIVLQAVEDQSWDLSVEDLIAFPLENMGIAREEIHRRVLTTVAELGCERLLGQRVRTLSGGEKRVAALASALIREPALLILDEPTCGLDPQARARMVGILRTLHEKGMTLLIAEQDLSWFEGLGERILFLGRDGRLTADLAWNEAIARDDLFHVVGIEPPFRPAIAPPPFSAGDETVPAIAVRGLQSKLERANGDPVLPSIHFELQPGEIAALIGPNGAGKSTLVQSLLGLRQKQRGTILIDGTSAEPLTIAERARHIGYVPQNVRRMFFLLTVLEEAVFSLSGGQMGQSAVRKYRDQAMELLSRVHLDEKAQFSPFMLSMREQLMLALACMEATNPALVILDEPLVTCDTKWRDAVLDFMKRSHVSKRAVLIITHDMPFAYQVSHRLLIMREGELVFDGPATEGWHTRAFENLGWPKPGIADHDKAEKKIHAAS